MRVLCDDALGMHPVLVLPTMILALAAPHHPHGRAVVSHRRAIAAQQRRLEAHQRRPRSHPRTHVRHRGRTPTLGLTAGEAFRAADGRIVRKVGRRLHGEFRGFSGCSAHAPGRQTPGSIPRYRRWRCHVEIRGTRFPQPCRAEAFVIGTHRRHVVRIDWLLVSRYCRTS